MVAGEYVSVSLSLSGNWLSPMNIRDAILFLSLAAGLFSCGSNVHTSNKVTSANADSALSRQALAGKATATETADKKLIGIWTDGSSENASFEIKSDSIQYLDPFEEYKYDRYGDSIVIYYSDYIYKGRIFLVKDTLVMKSNEESKFWRFER